MKRLCTLLKDNFSGSGTLLLKTQEILLLAGKSEEQIESDDLLNQLEQLKDYFPQFALLHHFVNDVKIFVWQHSHILGSQLTLFIENYQKQWQNAQQKANEKLLNTLSLTGKNILLHSNSSALQSLFNALAKRKKFPTVWQTVSSPVNEGILQAKVLKNIGFEVHLFHEDAISKFLRDIDIAIFGADVVTDHLFINKIGTYPLSLIMKQENKPVYVLSEIRKRMIGNNISWCEILTETPKPAKEIIENPDGFIVHNYYFEATPLSLIKQVFTETEPI